MQRGDRHLEIEVIEFEDAQLPPVRTILDLPQRDEAKTSAARHKRELQVMPQDFRYDPQRYVRKIERSLNGVPVTTSVRI